MLIPRLPEHSISVWSCSDDHWLMFVVLEMGEGGRNCFQRGGRVKLKGTCSEGLSCGYLVAWMPSLELARLLEVLADPFSS